jgi:HSP20 family protein
MTLLRWEPIHRHNPWTRLNQLQRQMNSVFDHFADEEESPTVSWSPPVNVIDFEDRIEVSAELPGMAQSDIKIELLNNVLLISGQRDRAENSEVKVYLEEQAFGNFHRSFQLSPQVDSDSINAKFKDGVLTIILTKKEEAKPKQIEIQD